MVIAILFIVTLMITIFAYQRTRLKLISLTFWASGMTCIFSGIYVLTYSSMKNDISFLTLLVLLGSIAVTGLGEFFANKARLKPRKANTNISGKRFFEYVDGEIVIATWKTVVISLIYLVVAVIRLRSMLSYTGGSLRNIMAAMTQMRYISMFTDEKVVLSGGIINQIGFACEVAVFVHLFAFIHNLTTVKKRNWSLLIILIPDFIVRFLTTSRSSFLFLLFGIVFCWFFMLVRQGRCKEFLLTPKRIAIIVILFAIFYWYGQVRNSVSISVTDYIQMYTCSSIYNLDKVLQEGWDKVPYFGYYTLQKIYSLLRINHTNIPSDLHMVVFNVNGSRSNIYTSLLKPILDYGILWTMVIRFLESILGTKVVMSIAKKREDKYPIYYEIYFLIIVLYCYANYTIGNRFIDYLGQPTLLLRYFIFGWFLVKFFFKPHLKDNMKKIGE